MTPQSAQSAYNEIVEHIKDQGGSCSVWYAGIASDWQDRLFNGHQVPRQGHWYIVRQCYNNADARNAEDALLKLGCDGGVGGGDQSTIYVYAYLKGIQTNP